MRTDSTNPVIRIEPLECDPQDVYKFIIVRDNMGQYVMCIGSPREEYHRDIAKNYGRIKDEILGGGQITLYGSKLVLGDRSEDFGGVPVEILRLFEEDLKRIMNAKQVELNPRTLPEDYERFQVPYPEYPYFSPPEAI